MNFATDCSICFSDYTWLPNPFLWYLFHTCDNHTSLIILLLSVVDISFVCVEDV